MTTDRVDEPTIEELLDTFAVRSLEAAARIMGKDELYDEARMQVGAARTAISERFRELEAAVTHLAIELHRGNTATDVSEAELSKLRARFSTEGQ